jgi:hypothetical protein
VRFLLPLLLLLAGCTTHPFAYEPPKPPPTTTTTPPPPPCPPPGVLIHTVGADAALGLRYLGLEMTNCGSTPFEVNGHPAVRVLDKDRRAEPVNVAEGTQGITIDERIDAPAKPVTLQPGEKARAELVWRNTTLDGETVNGVFLEVAPVAGQPVQIVTPTYVSSANDEELPLTIDLGTTGKLGVGPWSKS